MLFIKYLLPLTTLYLCALAWYDTDDTRVTPVSKRILYNKQRHSYKTANRHHALKIKINCGQRPRQTWERVDMGAQASPPACSDKSGQSPRSNVPQGRNVYNRRCKPADNIYRPCRIFPKCLTCAKSLFAHRAI